MRAIFSVIAGGADITSNLTPVLISLKVSDKAGQTSDSASIKIDDTGGQIVMPPPRAPLIIKLGWEGQGVGVVFSGVVGEVKANGDRSSGRTITISAKGFDTRGKAKQPQRRHFDDASIGDALGAAGEFAGIEVMVDPAFASITRPYMAMDDESFVAFGERLAMELGGTFKIVSNRAVLARRNGGVSVSGAALPTVTAAWGANLHSYDISPILGRPVEKQTLTRWYDSAAAAWQLEAADTGTDDAETIQPSRFSQADPDAAGDYATGQAGEADRKAGEGSVVIEGNIGAQPEGLCVVTGCRPGVDGLYRIEGVEHEHGRSGGFTTKLDLRQPKGGAGQDSRGGE